MIEAPQPRNGKSNWWREVISVLRNRWLTTAIAVEVLGPFCCVCDHSWIAAAYRFNAVGHRYPVCRRSIDSYSLLYASNTIVAL